jgi:hypothetical protein
MLPFLIIEAIKNLTIGEMCDFSLGAIVMMLSRKEEFSLFKITPHSIA